MSPELLADLSALGKKTPDEIAATMPHGWRHCEHRRDRRQDVRPAGKRHPVSLVYAFDNGEYPELCNDKFYAELEGEEL